MAEPHDPIAAGPATILSGDRPKERLADDRLGFGGFARALAQSIARLAPRDGVVLAVHGPWGSGKTSAVNMAMDALADLETEDARTLVARFNPWWFSEQENLTRAFFAEVSAALGSKVSSRVLEGLRGVARRAAGAKGLIGAGVALVPGLGVLKDLAEGGLETLGALADDERSLDAARRELEEALREEGKRILVIIDDIDRLPADEARQIFRLVKSVADLPNVIYLLVFDREIARRALNEAADPNGPEWLEKIVQASFDLPPVHRIDLQRLFLGRLEEIVGPEPPIQPGRWPDVFHRAVAPWLRTPRDATRLANAVAVAWPVVGDKVDLADFVAIETLRLAEPQVYDKVRHNASAVTGLGDAREDQKAFAEELLAGATPARRNEVRAALQLLFPRLERAWANHAYDGGFMAGWDKARRICSPRRFPSYFTFTLSDDVLGEAELEEVVGLLSDPAAFAARIDDYARLRRRGGGTKADLVLDELSHDEALLPSALRITAAQALLHTADHFIPDVEERGFATVPALWRIWWAIEAVLTPLDAPERVRLLVEAMAASPALQTLAHVVSSLRTQHGRHGEEHAQPESQRLVDAAGLAEIEAAFRARMAAGGDTLLGRAGLRAILYAWAGVAGEPAVRAWTTGAMATDAGAVRLAEVATSTAAAGAIGSYAVVEIPQVDRKALGEILDVDALLARLDACRGAAAASDAVIERFLKGLAGRRGG
ncbi:MAG TPA: P-loop NTPase fold protein [Phenylobacterium sp.]|nr:P-loop NTPase fold protein [Phenylobacterium sp.]